MTDTRAVPLSRSRFALLACLFAVLVCYASTVIGPQGPHFVPIDPAAALRQFIRRLAVWVDNGSDQRSDWMGNLTMLVPLGFLLTGSIWPRGPGVRRAVAACGALCLCLAFVLGVKYVQLFFPPRTVTLNYVVAQGLGALAGVLLFWASHGRLALLARGFAGNGRESLIVLLQVYTAALVVFMLMPLDFALSAEDLRACLGRLPDIVVTVTGAGRPPLVRVVLVLVGTAALVPVGMLLTLTRGGTRAVGRSILSATALGFLAMLAVLALSALVLSAAPSLVAVLYRTAGIALGAWLMHWLARRDPRRVRYRLARLVPWAVPPYLALVLAVSGLLSPHWRTGEEALAQIHPFGLMPFYYYYIVTKAEAAKNIAAHAVMYAPIGVMVWLRGWGTGRGATAFLLAALLGLCVELGRAFRPGLEGDINAVLVAGASAWLATRVMPRLWWMLESVTPRAASPPQDAGTPWRARAAAARAGFQPRGEVERF